VQKIEEELIKNVVLTSLQKSIAKAKRNAEVNTDEEILDDLLDQRGMIISEYDKLSDDMHLKYQHYKEYDNDPEVLEDQ
jgi:hypothetical protein